MFSILFLVRSAIETNWSEVSIAFMNAIKIINRSKLSFWFRQMISMCDKEREFVNKVDESIVFIVEVSSRFYLRGISCIV